MISRDTSLYYSESLEQANALYVLYAVVPLGRVSLSPLTLIFREPFTYAGRHPYYLRAWIILPDDHNKSKAELSDFFATKSAKVEAKYEFANAKQPYN